MSCQQCGGPTKKPTMKFCSVDCKSAAQKGKREVLDPSKKIKCKIDGKVYDDYLNRSGCLRRYSESTLNKEFDWEDWEIITVDVKPTWNCPHCDWTTVDIENKSGWITVHLQDKHGITPEQHCETYPEDRSLWIEYWKHYNHEQFKSESSDNRVQCLECGEYFTRINNKHLAVHGMTLEEYDRKYPHSTRWSVATTEKARKVYYSDAGLSNFGFDSKGQVEIKEFIESMGFPTQKIRSGMYEIDIFVPDRNIGFEYNGLFHHSEFRSGRGEKYHIGKTRSAEVDGIKLIHIFDDEWNNKQSIVKSRISNLLGKSPNKFYARNCVIKTIDTPDLRRFLDDNHLQGYTHSDVSFGLFFNNELLQCMTFGTVRSKVSKKEKQTDHYELIRMCTKLNCNVIGGADKILKFFEDMYYPKLIVTYADRRWTSSIGESIYDKLGFEKISETDPCFWGTRNYTKRDNHRSFFTKKNMSEKYPDVFVNVNIDDLTQSKMMEMIGFDRVWDCGNFKYVKKYDQNVDIPDDDEYDDTEFHYLGSRHRRGNIEKRNDNDVKCEICQLHYPVVGMANHLRYSHHVDPISYIAQYGEYRPSILKKK